jgi:hypothetical protein
MSRNGLEVQPTWMLERNSSSFQHIIDIHLNYGTLQEVLKWCQSNLKSGWAYNPANKYAVSYGTVYNFYFDNEKDASVFVLRWKN